MAENTHITPLLVPLANIIAFRIKSSLSGDDGSSKTDLAVHFGGQDLESPLWKFFNLNNIKEKEQMLLLLSLAPHLQPDFFHLVIADALPQAGDFPKLGLRRGKNFHCFLPTGETILFLLAGDDMDKRLEIQQLFSEDHFLAQKHILWLEDVPEGEPRMSGRIILSQEYVDLLTTGKVVSSRFNLTFPGKVLKTEMEWSDLVLHPDTLGQIKNLKIWIQHNDILMKDWKMRRRLKPGYRAIFYGSPGTGKTLTASLLGKSTGKEVYRIDLSRVVSKYIGETEKNLVNLFAKAERNHWILFFDEADALFGKRTSVRDAHDKYANQKVSYLLQQIEDYNGLVILALKSKSNLDPAFVRRYNAIIHFPMPTTKERQRIWETAIPPKATLAIDVDLSYFAAKFDLSGAAITNVIQFASLQTIHRNSNIIAKEYLLEGIKREYEKEEKVFQV